MDNDGAVVRDKILELCGRIRQLEAELLALAAEIEAPGRLDVPGGRSRRRRVRLRAGQPRLFPEGGRR